MFKMQKKRSEKLGISLSEAIAVNFGHEIEHTTSENLELVYQNVLKKEIEYVPNQISKDMITEFVYLMKLKSLKDIQILPDPLIQTKPNIDIKVKE